METKPGYSNVIRVPIGEPLVTSVLTDKHFVAWYDNTFGNGCRSGEEHIIRALKEFFYSLVIADLCPVNYDKQGPLYYHSFALEERLGPLAAWLLIEVLANSDLIDWGARSGNGFIWGTSSRNGFITPKGVILRDYLATKTSEELYSLVTDWTAEEEYCFPDRCQCETPCNNPLWKKSNG